MHIHFSEFQAVRCAVDLEPVDGPGGRFFPSTYEGGKHVVERLPDGTHRVLVDSVASQANRHEASLVAARGEGLIDFSDVYVDLSGTEAGIAKLAASEMPHRLSDAILRDSEVDGVAFGKSDFGQKVLSATASDLTPLLEASPTTLLFGCWFSQHNLKRPLKIQRSVASEVWAHNAVLGKAVGSRIDPLGIEKLTLYEAADGDWTARESSAVQGKDGRAKIYAASKPSAINHGNIAPQMRDQGATAERVVLTWSLPLAAVRKLRFGGATRDQVGQQYIATLGLLARILNHGAGYSFRSRCDFVSKGILSFDLIKNTGEIEKREITQDDAIGMFRSAEREMVGAGFKVCQRVEAKPSKKLVDLIAVNAEHQASAGEDA